MEQRLRLVTGGHHQARSEKRASERRPVQVPGQIVWKDARGNTKLTSVVTRDVSEYGVSVDCLNGAAIPLYRLVQVQLDREMRDADALPGSLQGRVLSAVYRVTPPSRAQHQGLALRLMVDPRRMAAAPEQTRATA